MQHKRMPQNKLEAVVFTATTALIMVYFATLYNTVLATGLFTNRTFLVAAQSMWLEYVLVFLCAHSISSPAAERFAFQVVRPGDRQIYVILAIQVFTVVFQVALASILGVWHEYGFTRQVLPDLPHDLLQELRHSAALATADCRTARPSDFPCNLLEG